MNDQSGRLRSDIAEAVATALRSAQHGDTHAVADTMAQQGVPWRVIGRVLEPSPRRRATDPSPAVPPSHAENGRADA